jgi:hypothetical protein
LRRRRADLWQRSALCEGAMWSESHTLGVIYEFFSRYIQNTVGRQIDAAWRSYPREHTAVTAVVEPASEKVRDVFFREIRANLSFNPWKRVALRLRYRQTKRKLERTLPDAIEAARSAAAHDPGEPAPSARGGPAQVGT